MSSFRSTDMPGSTSQSSNDKFLENLRNFHKTIGSPFVGKPMFAGKEIDLAALYRKVTSSGGCAQVTSQRKWKEIAEAFKLPSEGCINSSYALRQLYLRYFEIYEKTNFFDEDLADIVSSGRLKLPHTTGYDRMAATSIEGDIRTSDTLMLALESGLPNEIEFALHILVEMSYDTDKPFLIVKMPCFIRRLLAVVGLFEEDYAKHIPSDKNILNVPEIDFVKFWENYVRNNEVKRLIHAPFPDQRDIEDNLEEEYKDNHLFDHDPGRLSKLAIDRVERVAVILLNLSFAKSNAVILSNTDVCLRFLLLCVCSKVFSIRSYALETLSNLSPEIGLESPTNYRTQILLKCIWKLMKSVDKHDVIKGMEIIAGLCENIDHCEVISSVTDSSIYKIVINYLTVPDVQLLITSLDVLFALTGLGEAICSQILAVGHSIDLLVSLVSLDVHKFGEEAMAGIYLFDKRSQISASRVVHAQPPQLSSNNIGDIAAIINPVITRSAEETARIDRDNENFTRAWLNATYDCCTGGYVPRSGIYSDYLATCNKLNIVGIVNSTTFGRLIHEIFPSAEIKRVSFGNSNQYLHTGIRKRPRPLPFTYTPSDYQRTTSINQASTMSAMNNTTQTDNVAGTAQTPPIPGMSPSMRPYNVAMGNVTANLHRIDTPSQGHQVSVNSQKQNTPISASLLANQLTKKTNQFIQVSQSPSVSTNLSTRNNGLTRGNSAVSSGSKLSRQDNAGNLNKVVATLSCDSTSIPTTTKDSESVHTDIFSKQSVTATNSSVSSSRLHILSENSFRILHPSNVSNCDDKEHDNSSGYSVKGNSKSHNNKVNTTNAANNLQNGATLHFRSDIASMHDRTSVGMHNNAELELKDEGSKSKGLISSNKIDSSAASLTSLKRKLITNQVDNKINGELNTSAASGDKRKGLHQSGICDLTENFSDNSAKITDNSTEIHSGVNLTNGTHLNKLDTSNKDTIPNEISEQKENTTYACKWSDCQCYYQNITDLANHAYNSHAGTSQGYCKWEGCLNDGAKRIKRARFSMIFHLQKHINNYGKTLNEKTTLKSYMPQPKIPLIAENELPLTKCVRLTAALILRNLVKFTHEAKTLLRRYEQHLASLAFDNLEASSALAYCLFELSKVPIDSNR